MRRLALAVALAASGGGCADDGGGADAAPGGLHGALAGDDCVIVVLDALHVRHLGCYGGPDGVSPRLDALAAVATRFERAWSPTSWTLPSTVSLFTGLYQESHGVAPPAGVADVRLGEAAVTLAELFAAAGYDTRAYTQNPWTGRAHGLDQGFERFAEIRSDGPPLAGQVLADLADRDGRPLFAYVHVLRPHTPYDPPEAFRAGLVEPGWDGPPVGTDEAVEAHNSGSRPMDAAALQRHLDLYRANVRAADADLGRLLDGLDRARTLVVVLSDHGEAFAEHGKLGHNWQSFEEYVRVPLLLAHPALPAGRVSDAPVVTLDLLPTLGELFDLDLSALQGGGAAAGGRSWRPLLEGRPAPVRPIFTSSRLDAAGRRQLAVSDGRWKLLRREPSGAPLLFDLRADPAERLDLSAERPEVLERLSRLLDDWEASQQPPAAAEWGAGLDPETEARLRELGYLK